MGQSKSIPADNDKSFKIKHNKSEQKQDELQKIQDEREINDLIVKFINDECVLNKHEQVSMRVLFGEMSAYIGRRLSRCNLNRHLVCFGNNGSPFPHFSFELWNLFTRHTPDIFVIPFELPSSSIDAKMSINKTFASGYVKGLRLKNVWDIMT
jgi:hypothetical protein